MTLLGIATSGARGSLALGEISPGQPLQTKQVIWEKKAMHSELATQQLQELLAHSGKTLADLTHLAVVIGPGSFTGIRVGVNVARTLAYGLSLPVFVFNSLEVLAGRYLNDGERGLIAIPALREFYYAAIFERTSSGLRTLMPVASLTREQFAPHLKPGMKSWIEGETSGFSSDIEAQDLLRALDQWPGAKSFSWKDVKPLYIRGSEAEEKLRLGLLKPL